MADKDSSIISFTSGIKQMLDSEVSFKPAQSSVPTATIIADTKSIYDYALDLGLTLQDYVDKFPESALRQAEAIYAQWLRIQEAAAIEGAITTTDENGEPQKYAITKNQTKLIADRVTIAANQAADIKNMVLFSPRAGERWREYALRTLGARATAKGDTRALTYMIDRVDGRPVEKKEVEMDYDNAYNVYQIIHTLFDKQLEVLNSGSGTKLICCSRRAGKTNLLVAALLTESLRKPNTICIYIGETMHLSEQLIDTAANQIIDACNLRDKRGKRLNWKKLDNNSVILVRGLSNTKDPDQIRGNKAKVIVIDEFFHLKSELLEYLQREVLEPMQMDYADDYKFICAGTPPSIKGTFGEFAWKTWDCPHYSWTWRENPHPVALEQRKAYVDNILAEKGLDWTSTFARREYNGEWAYDDDLLLYPDFHTYDVHGELPKLHVDQVMFGIDYGVSDNDVLLGIAWDSEAQQGYIFHEDKFNRLDIQSQTISQLQYLGGQVKYAWRKAMDFFQGMSPREANKRILWDADDNNQHLTDEFNINIRLDDYPDLRLNIQNAHKTDKELMCDKIRDLLRTGGLLLPAGGKTEKECMSTVLRRGPNGQVYHEVDDNIYHPDVLPAMRYALYNVLQ